MAVGTTYTSEDLLDEIYDLLWENLPQVPQDDPARPTLVTLLRQLGRAMGKPPIAEVR